MEAHPDLVATVQQGLQASAAWAALWKAYCRVYASNVTNPLELDESFLAQALSAIPIPASNEPTPEHKDLIALVKDRQSKKQWQEEYTNYCQSYGNGTKDPKLHSIEFLRSAIDYCDTMASTERPSLPPVEVVLKPMEGYTPFPSADENPEYKTEQHTGLVNIFKERAKAKGWNEAYGQFCKIHAGGIRDPNRHTCDFLEAAFQHATLPPALHEVPGEVAGGTPSTAVSIPADIDALSRDELIQEVKNGRKCASWAQRWAQFCFERAGGTRDPARHSDDMLKAALVVCGTVPDTDSLVESCDVVLQQALKKKMADRLWEEMWFYYIGKLPPRSQLLDEHLRDAISWVDTMIMANLDVPSLVAQDSEVSRTGKGGFHTDSHRMLIEQVKARRLDRTFQQLWSNYVNLHGKGVRDPARHDASFLISALACCNAQMGVGTGIPLSTTVVPQYAPYPITKASKLPPSSTTPGGSISSKPSSTASSLPLPPAGLVTSMR